MEIELSPYIHPPFKIATSRSNRLRMKNVVELCALDVSQSPRVFAMKLRYEFWSGDFRGSVTPYKTLGKLSDILHLNNRNNQLER